MTSSTNNYALVASVVATYWFVSISMVYLNKILLSNEEVSISAPIFVTWFQCVVTTAICYVAGELGERARKHHYAEIQGDDDNEKSVSKPPSSFCAQFPKAEYVQSRAVKVFPLSLAFVGMITCNNLCLKYVEVSFYTVARSFAVIFNVIFSFVILGVPTSSKVLLCLAGVVVGFVVSSEGEVNFSLMGTSFGVLSSVFVSLNSIYTKKILPVVDDDMWRLTFYNNVNASVLFLPIILFFEYPIIVEGVLSGKMSSHVFWGTMLVAGFFGFSIGIATVLQIKTTSPLTHLISATAKGAVQSTMAFVVWGNEATTMGLVGLFTVIGGSMAYALVRMSEGTKPVETKITEMDTVQDKDSNTALDSKL